MARKPKQTVEAVEAVDTDNLDEITELGEATDIDQKREDFEKEPQDLSQVEDISVGNAEFNENTVFLVLKTFTIIIGNGAVEGEVGKKIKISKADEGVIKALLSKGYIKIVG